MMSSAFISSLVKQKSIWTLMLALLIFFLGGFYVNARYDNQLNVIKEKSNRREYLSVKNVSKILLDSDLPGNSSGRIYRVDVEFSTSAKEAAIDFNQYSVAFLSKIENGVLIVQFRELTMSDDWRAMYQDQVKLILPTSMSNMSIKGSFGASVAGSENNDVIPLASINMMGCENNINIGKIKIQKMLVQRQCDKPLSENRYGAGIDIQQQADIDFLEITSPTGRISIDDASRIDRLALNVGGQVLITAPAQLLQKAHLQTATGAAVHASPQ